MYENHIALDWKCISRYIAQNIKHTLSQQSLSTGQLAKAYGRNTQTLRHGQDILVEG